MILIILLLSDTITLLVKGDFMFIDKKIKEYIGNEKEGWQDAGTLLEELKTFSKKQKELYNYLSTYDNDFLHQKMKEDFDKVLDNIKSLANVFNFKMGIEISILNAILLHGGYLSLKRKYSYKTGIFDIKEFMNDKTLHIALKVFAGYGCCRHTSSFIKQVLDRVNIKNNMVRVDVNEVDYNINEIRLFLSNIHKRISHNPNHVINYIGENDYNYFLDLTTNQIEMFTTFNQFATSVDDYASFLPLYSYEYSL